MTKLNSKIETKYNLQTILLDTLTKYGIIRRLRGFIRETTLKLTSQIHPFSRLPTFQRFYDTEAIQLVTNIFNEDFEAYHYFKMDISNIRIGFSVLE